ncbi:tripartite tricarboxylate transporter substrate binding protein [Ramlibacter sp. AW1]|uniref:Tripartite tricarboxylate transporter substrate binding protein n=1 Tax=Ramlibacter aurantiacus TaxID=2801330 RepID=A0A936ZXL0_9BURK|nr:tripartite tricarboxylate transporter substrate binding protein [Ramlibacter aurantiacus]MBL0422955.1 tripartite tricarboxylate transporter substrate binding protein [Ramlibacter aurantiacus]
MSAFNMLRRAAGRLGLLVAATALVAGAPAHAQEFPVKGKPIRIVVSFPPGAGPDAMARVLIPKLQEQLGVPVVIDNRPGAGTLVSANEVMKSAPDGHTIFFSASSTMAQAPHTLKMATYDPVTAFTPITLGAKGPLVVIVNSALGINNIQELIAWGKANPGKLSYGSFGVGTSSHIFGQVFARNTGLPMEHVPYKGGAEMSADLTEGRLPMAFDAAPAAMTTAKTGKARIIAVAAPQRSPFLPGVPTVVEQGVKDLDITSFLGWFGPPGMKPEVVNKLNAALRAAISQPEVSANYNVTAYTAETSTPQELAEEVKRSYAAWGALVRTAGIEKQ